MCNKGRRIIHTHREWELLAPAWWLPPPPVDTIAVDPPARQSAAYSGVHVDIRLKPHSNPYILH